MKRFFTASAHCRSLFFFIVFGFFLISLPHFNIHLHRNLFLDQSTYSFLAGIFCNFVIWDLGTCRVLKYFMCFFLSQQTDNNQQIIHDGNSQISISGGNSQISISGVSQSISINSQTQKAIIEQKSNRLSWKTIWNYNRVSGREGAFSKCIWGDGLLIEMAQGQQLFSLS